MAHINFTELKMHGGVPLPFTPGYTGVEPPAAAAPPAGDTPPETGELSTAEAMPAPAAGFGPPPAPPAGLTPAPSASVPLPRRANPYGALTLTLTSPPEAEGLAIEYAVVLDGEEMRRDRQELAFSGKFDREGQKLWNLLSMPVPHGAEVRFTVHYRIGGETLVHDDEGEEFVVTAP
ncbi:hypothetical protein [Longimicrobium sp.]|jgi:hypothetical protein|uniref:hypothetical protein n=1 Tax=Longimicrobium sp. TaxID=2029185 RepID=UPI002F95A5C0